MSSVDTTLGRRLFLRGLGGATLGLPFLEAFTPRRAAAQELASPFLVVVASANGVVQARSGETEAWWPTQLGGLTQASMAADRATRASGELEAYAERLLFVRGVDHALGSNGCNHASGCAQLLTASPTLSGRSNQTAADTESVDTLIARSINAPGVEPLFLHIGMYQAGGSGFNVPSYISYAGARQQRTGLDSPLKAYHKIIGTSDASPAGAADPLALRRQSVNDLLRKQIESLRARTELTADDRHRLDQHFTTIRDIEVQISEAAMADAKIAQMNSVEPVLYDRENHEPIQRLHMDLMVFALSSGYTRVAVLQVGDREDDHEYVIDGTTVQFHTASHRTLPNSYELCKAIDRIQINHFKYLLDTLAATNTASGPLIDQGTIVNTNQLGTGPDHSMNKLPYIIVGKPGGFFSTGRFVDLGNVPNARMLNTLAASVGVTTTMGGDSALLGQLLT